MTRTKRDRLTPYRENMKARTVTDADLSAGFRDALKRADTIIVARGGQRRPLAELDDVTRAAAMARLAQLTAGGERGAA